MKICYLLVLCTMLSTTNVFAQQITGYVYNVKNKVALPGATIVVDGKAMTSSGADGSFSLPCSDSKNIVVSHIGFTINLVGNISCGTALKVMLVPENYNLEAVEITATSASNKSLLYQPSSITKIETKEIKRGNGLYLDEAVNGNIPGVSMNRRGVSSGQQFNIRGYGNGARGTRGISSNFDGQGYKLYLNGIPVTDAEGITTMDDIDFNSIGNVEITKGPAGSLYGLAIAGVVNLSTIKPEAGKTSVSQEAMVGNYGLQRYTTQFQKGTERTSLLLNYGHQKSDGYTLHNASTKDFVNFITDFRASQKQSINTYFGYSNSYDERSGELTLSQWAKNDYSGNIEYIKRDAHSKVYTVRAGATHNYLFNDRITNSTTVFGTGFNSNASSAGGWTDKASTNFGLRSAFATKVKIRKNILLSGITGNETQRQNASTITYNMIDPQGAAHVWKLGDPYFIIGSYAAGNNGTNSNVYTETSTTSLFSEWTIAFPKDLSLTAGIGYSSMKIKLEDRFYVPNKPTHYDTTYKKMWSPHLAINKVFNKEISVYAGYSRAYKAPVSSYFYIPYSSVGGPQTGIVNSRLKPEVADQFEIGTKGNLLNDKLNYQLAAFRISYHNKFNVVAVPFNSTTTLFSYVTNGGNQVNKGLEALVKYTVYKSTNKFFTNISPFANATYADFKYKDYPFHIIKGTQDSIVNFDGKKAAGVGKVVANIGLDVLTRPGLYANVTYFYKDKMPITSDNLYYASSYSLLNANLGYSRNLSNHFALNVFLGINNITETKHPIMVFINQLPDAYVAGPGKANYFGNINLKYSF